MPRVLLLAARPSPGGTADTLRAHLPRERFLVSAATLPAGRPDLREWGRLAAAVVGFAPDVLHAVGPAAAVAGYLYRSGKRAKVAVSDVGAVGPGAVGWATARALRAADRVVAGTDAEAEELRRLGVAADRLAVVPPAVPSVTGRPDRATFRAATGIPADAVLIAAVGRPRDAALAFDVLKYPHPDVYLAIVGRGPEVDRADRLSRHLGFDDHRVRLAPPGTDPLVAVGCADLAWVLPGEGMAAAALAAMAAGVPVVAADAPAVRGLVADGPSGRAAAADDRVGLAAVTRRLLLDRADMGRLGEAGRRRAGEFSGDRMAGRWAAVYDGLTRP